MLGSQAKTEVANAGLFLRLLGGFAVQIGAWLVPEKAFERRKARSLLKLLALEPEHCLHREQVMERLWSDLGPSSAPAQLYKAIHQVRQALAAAGSGLAPESLLVLFDETLWLDAPGGVHSDVQEFETLAEEAFKTQDLEALEHAVSAYGGELLPADRYEAWTFERREALRECLVDLLVVLGEVRLEVGRPALAAEAFRRALEHDGLREAAHRGLMRIWFRQGDQAGLERQYHRCCEVFTKVLNSEPSLETRKLHVTLRAEAESHEAGNQ